MFKRQEDKKIDYTSLIRILSTGKKLITIFYVMTIVLVILLSTYLFKEWNIFKFISELLVVISPIFIGLLIAWLFEPMVTSLEKKKIPRILGCLLVYVLLIGGLFLIGYLFVPSLISQIKDLLMNLRSCLC